MAESRTLTRNKTSGKKTHIAKAYRFDARLNEAQKMLIQRAAELESRSITDFVLQSAETSARRTVLGRSI